MKIVKLFSKFSLLVIISLSFSFANATELTGAHFIKTFEQIEALGKQKTKGAEAIMVQLAANFNLAKDLPPPEFNFVVFELLNKYSKYPQLRGSIQGILSNLADNMNDEIFDARQRFETPMVVARSIYLGFTIVGIARLYSTLYRVAYNGLNGLTISKTDNINKVLQQEKVSTTNTLKRMPIGNRMMLATSTVYQKCMKSARCHYTMTSLLVGATTEAFLYYWDSLSQQKVHPLQALRIVQAHLGCELHWNILDYNDSWYYSSNNPTTIAIKINELEERAKELEESYANLMDLYKNDLSEYKKYYPDSKKWFDLATTIMEPNGRTCNQISTTAMKSDLNVIKNNYRKHFSKDVESALKEEVAKQIENLKVQIILNHPNQEPLKHMFETPLDKNPVRDLGVKALNALKSLLGEKAEVKKESAEEEKKPEEENKPAEEDKATPDEKTKEKQGDVEVPDFEKNKEEL